MRITDVRSLQLEITSRCNARCAHCARFTEDGSLHPTLTLDHWDMTTVIKNLELDQMPNLSFVEIEGDKGDPASHPKLQTLVEEFALHPNSPAVMLYTNGSIRTPDFWKCIGAYANTSTVFSIDGLHDTNHLYRVGCQWDRIMENAKAYIDAGGRAIWKCIVFKHNQHQLMEIKNLARQMGFAEVSFRLPRVYEFSRKPRWLIYDRQQFLGELLPPVDITYTDCVRISEIFLPQQKALKSHNKLPKICPNLQRGHLYVTYRSHVIPCCMMHNYLYESRTNAGARRMMQELVGDVDSLDLSTHPLSTVLMSRFFDNELEEHFRGGPHLPVCAKSCHDGIITNLINQKTGK